MTNLKTSLYDEYPYSGRKLDASVTISPETLVKLIKKEDTRAFREKIAHGNTKTTKQPCDGCKKTYRTPASHSF